MKPLPAAPAGRPAASAPDAGHRDVMGHRVARVRLLRRGAEECLDPVWAAGRFPAYPLSTSNCRDRASCSRYGNSATIQLSRSSGVVPGPKQPGGNDRPAGTSGRPVDDTGRPVRRLEIVQPQHQLLEVVLTLHACGGLPNATDRGEQETDQDAEDGDGDQDFDQGHAVACGPGHGWPSERYLMCQLILPDPPAVVSGLSPQKPTVPGGDAHAYSAGRSRGGRSGARRPRPGGAVHPRLEAVAVGFGRDAPGAQTGPREALSVAPGASSTKAPADGFEARVQRPSRLPCSASASAATADPPFCRRQSRRVGQAGPDAGPAGRRPTAGAGCRSGGSARRSPLDPPYRARSQAAARRPLARELPQQPRQALAPLVGVAMTSVSNTATIPSPIRSACRNCRQDRSGRAALARRRRAHPHSPTAAPQAQCPTSNRTRPGPGPRR